MFYSGDALSPASCARARRALRRGAPPLRPREEGPALAELMTALPVAMLVVRPDNRIADANVRAETLLNMARSAIIGSGWK